VAVVGAHDLDAELDVAGDLSSARRLGPGSPRSPRYDTVPEPLGLLRVATFHALSAQKSPRGAAGRTRGPGPIWHSLCIWYAT